ncbi:MAG: hypothetical protein LBI44_00080 [Oscillospiraceae bacterium]|jgi:hypothetical protein|nr:hypothetical protein [Oscillospiraceae bacterium]
MANTGRKTGAELARKQRQDDLFTYRVLAAFAAAIGYIMALVWLYRLLTEEGKVTLVHGIALYGGIAFLALALGAVCAAYALRSRALLSPLCLHIAGLAAVAAFALLYLRRYSALGITPLYVALPVMALLYLLCYIYKREFIFTSLISFGSAFGFWLVSEGLRYSAQRPYVNRTIAVFWAVTALAAAAALLWRSKKGIRLGKLLLRPPDGKCKALLYACGVTALGLAASMLFGSAAAFYAIFACFAYWFAAAVYYTAKLI